MEPKLRSKETVGIKGFPLKKPHAHEALSALFSMKHLATSIHDGWSIDSFLRQYGFHQTLESVKFPIASRTSDPVNNEPASTIQSKMAKIDPSQRQHEFANTQEIESCPT
jgi:hypothetical protein